MSSDKNFDFKIQKINKVNWLGSIIPVYEINIYWTQSFKENPEHSQFFSELARWKYPTGLTPNGFSMEVSGECDESKLNNFFSNLRDYGAIIGPYYDIDKKDKPTLIAADRVSIYKAGTRLNAVFGEMERARLFAKQMSVKNIFSYTSDTDLGKNLRSTDQELHCHMPWPEKVNQLIDTMEEKLDRIKSSSIGQKQRDALINQTNARGPSYFKSKQLRKEEELECLAQNLSSFKI